MKTLVTKTLVSIIGLLSACAISFGQASDSTYIQPKAGAANFFVEGSASYFFASTGDHDNLAGVGISIGWRAGSVVKLQLENGIYFSSKTRGYYYYSGYGYGNWYTVKEDLTVIPVLFSPSFCISLGSSGRAELRFTPSLGFSYIKVKNGYYNDSQTPFTYGFGIGFTYHFSRQFYADAGLRWLGWTSSGSVDTAGNAGLTLAGGWKF